MLRGISFLDPSVAGIVHHHERWDGAGYPAGLAGERIPLLARIVAVADGFSALVAPRQDRAALDPQLALAAMQTQGGAAYDDTVLGALARVLARHHGGVDDPAAPPARLSSAVAHDEPGRAAHRLDAARGLS